MYTYESFETSGMFTLMRPIFITLLVLSILLLLLVLLPQTKNKIINGFTVSSISLVSILISAQLLYSTGIIVDEIGLDGDALSTYLFLAIVGLCFVNPIVFFVKNSNPN
ncbi:hypothetical protein [Psychrobacillus vulpis]|uniref:Uncharacterized protein n=1 Tax=Psychrobacillus vulpis TaxID=2325572 RepID=A0A544TQ93_9BACI|nr:hypothetical protein [Psychrobacillus vulpis]TQR19621.1 hypothetical protein FG384_11880 [Psychrobacillus vulpis]